MRNILYLVFAALVLIVCQTGCFDKTQNPPKASVKIEYMVVDILTGNISLMDKEPAGGWSDIYKTTKLVLRKIEPGTFIMGSPTDELGRGNDETQHEVTLTRPFYIGIFEITQEQYRRITGDNPPRSFRTDTMPVDNLSYNDIRGEKKGAKWPANNDVDEDSFLGKLRAKTGQAFDLPTEAQWEYACRAGTTTALNNGKNLSKTRRGGDRNLVKLGRYYDNNPLFDGMRKYGMADGHDFVGWYAPNFWGLYDMHGNAWEWCLDWYGDYPAGPATDPAGPDSGKERVLRGGSFFDSAYSCRSANRSFGYPNYADKYKGGFRVVLVQ